jgi:uncharacterized protein
MKILITGGTGLVGTRLSEMLIEKGHEVVMLSRKAEDGAVKKYKWDIRSGYIDAAAFEDTDVIVHLAGAGVFEKPWSDTYKKEIIDSRVQTTELLCSYLSSANHKVKTIICASAIGFYGIDTTDFLCKESTKQGKGFLAEVVNSWEVKQNLFNALSMRVVAFRIGIVLSTKGGALKEFLTPIRNFIGAPLGSGKQYVSWIHIDDLCRMVVFAIDNSNVKGVYNAVGLNPLTNSQLTKKIAYFLKKPLWLPNIPGIVLKLIFGTEKGAHIIGGNKVSCEKITEEGFTFNHPNIDTALRDLVENNK